MFGPTRVTPFRILQHASSSLSRDSFAHFDRLVLNDTWPRHRPALMAQRWRSVGECDWRSTPPQAARPDEPSAAVQAAPGPDGRFAEPQSCQVLRPPIASARTIEASELTQNGRAFDLGREMAPGEHRAAAAVARSRKGGESFVSSIHEGRPAWRPASTWTSTWTPGQSSHSSWQPPAATTFRLSDLQVERTKRKSAE